MWSLCHMWVFWQIYEMNPSFQRWALWDNQGPFRALQLRGNSPGVVFTLSKPSRLNTFCEFEEFQLYLQIPSIRPLLEIAIRNCHQKWSSDIVIKNCHQKLSSKIFIKNCHQKLSSKIVNENCHQKLPSKIVIKNCLKKLS